MTYAQKASEAQEEQLDWLHEIHEAITAQTRVLADIRRHTGLLYAIGIIWLVLFVVAAIIYLIAATA